MKAIELYNILEKDFVIPSINENWYDNDMSINDEYICDNFKQRSLGLLCDFTDEIKKVYTAVFPSDKILTRIIDDNVTDAMLFLHHPLAWDLSIDPNIAFYQINTDLLKKMKERRISLFNFHLPLDNYSEYATTKTLANALGIEILKAYNLYNGAVCGVIGRTACKTVQELQKKLSQTVGHETKLYLYGESEIENGIVSLCAGGGNDYDVVLDMINENIKVHITGISVKNRYSEKSHELEKENKINLLGATHYSTEKFACMAMCDYFKKLGLEAEFIVDVPCLADL
jgi:putative NIF3 family GTP cyclohydrolase 1 type 2